MAGTDIMREREREEKEEHCLRFETRRNEEEEEALTHRKRVARS